MSVSSISFFQAEDGIRDGHVTGVQTCALPISPQTPYGSRTCRECSRHISKTGHVAQTALAALSRCRRAAPRSPSGWKKSVGSASRHAPWYCQSHKSIIGPGSREISAMSTSLIEASVVRYEQLPLRYNRFTSYSSPLFHLLFGHCSGGYPSKVWLTNG